MARAIGALGSRHRQGRWDRSDGTFENRGGSQAWLLQRSLNPATKPVNQVSCEGLIRRQETIESQSLLF